MRTKSSEWLRYVYISIFLNLEMYNECNVFHCVFHTSYSHNIV